MNEHTDAETGFVYLRARYYDPGTGQFLSRDPLVALTQSAYGYVDGNPLNGTDPLGLYWGEGAVKSIGNRIQDAGTTLKMVGQAAAWASTYPALSAVNWAAEHTGGSITACLGWCVGLEVNHGQVYLNYSGFMDDTAPGGPAIGWSMSANYYNHPLDEWGCGGSQMVGVGPISGSLDRTNPKNASVGVGPGMLFGTAPMNSVKIL